METDRIQTDLTQTDRSAGRNSIDDILEVYKRDVDLTMLDASLKRTVAERLQALQDFERSRSELREATVAAVERSGR